MSIKGKPEPIHFGDLIEFSLWDRKIYFYINYIHPIINSWMRSFCTKERKMQKPEPKVKTILDYHDCEKFIAHKLGVEDLRNFADHKFLVKETKDNPPYQDFWHFLLDANSNVINGCFVFVPEIEDEYEDWQKTICQAFHDEFGVETEYWVEW